ncbi:Detected protein of confused Function [Hibiscus syriacus]|uniref:Detected protein of confused Function n=1 Tax=Hibiscus syriacus TaxID=106335 RepID=A0A6A2WCM5_HIBSY|nr:Detected protein of confused Function [Hibiscus syriacus]
MIMLSPLSSFPHRREAGFRTAAVCRRNSHRRPPHPVAGKNYFYTTMLGDGFIAITGACLGPVLRVEFGESPSYVVTHPIELATWAAGVEAAKLMESSTRRRRHPTLFGWPVKDAAIEAKGASTQALWNGIETGRDLSPEVIESCLMCYAKKYIPGTSRSNRKPSSSSAAPISESEQLELLETIIWILPLEKTRSTTATRFLFGLLRTANILNESESSKTTLEKKIGYFLDGLEERNAAGIEAENEGKVVGDEEGEEEELVGVTRGEEGRSSSSTWRAAVRENQVLRLDMDSMRTWVHQLERECWTMKKVIQKTEKEGPRGGGRTESLNKRLGCKFKTQVCDSTNQMLRRDEGEGIIIINNRAGSPRFCRFLAGSTGSVLIRFWELTGPDRPSVHSSIG